MEKMFLPSSRFNAITVPAAVWGPTVRGSRKGWLLLEILFQTYFVPKFLYHSMCFLGGGLGVGRAAIFAFDPGPKMSQSSPASAFFCHDQVRRFELSSNILRESTPTGFCFSSIQPPVKDSPSPMTAGYSNPGTQLLRH